MESSKPLCVDLLNSVNTFYILIQRTFFYLLSNLLKMLIDLFLVESNIRYLFKFIVIHQTISHHSCILLYNYSNDGVIFAQRCFLDEEKT